eukprot:1543024-Pyramimonas_sp.AAC.1
MKFRVTLACFRLPGAENDILWLQQGCMPGDPAMVRLFVGAYARQMGMGSINISNYRAASFKCPWSAQWIQASFTVYVDDVADNFDVTNNAASIMAEG